MTEKEIISLTYYDTADVYRIIEVEDAYGINRQERVKVYENIKCSLSQRNIQKLGISDMSNLKSSMHVLFTDDDVKIIPADIVHITNLDMYYKAGVSFMYPNSHSETILSSQEIS